MEGKTEPLSLGFYMFFLCLLQQSLHSSEVKWLNLKNIIYSFFWTGCFVFESRTKIPLLCSSPAIKSMDSNPATRYPCDLGKESSLRASVFSFVKWG